MSKFSGFPAGKVRFTRLPGPLFTDLLPQIDDLGEMKLTLYFLWRLEQMEGTFRYLSKGDLASDDRFMSGLGDQAGALDDALQRAVERGTLLGAQIEIDGDLQQLFFLNSPRGQTAVQAIQKGEWKPSGDPQQPIALDREAPNIFRLYEEHIGPLTPMIAETLKDTEESYPPQWIEEALRIAVENNVRRWRYVEAILRSWQEGGRDERTHRRDTEKDRRKYVEGEFSEFIEH